jgi:hypothetical protein
MAHVRQPFLDEFDRQVVQLRKVIRRKIDTRRLVSHPFDIFLNVVNVFDRLGIRIGVIEPARGWVGEGEGREGRGVRIDEFMFRYPPVTNQNQPKPSDP